MRVGILGCKDFPAFATPGVWSGGMEVYVDRMVRSLEEEIDFTLLTVGGRSEGHVRVEALGGARGMRTQPVSLLLRSWRAAARLAPSVDVFNPHTPLSALAARRVFRRFGVPYVVTSHVFGADATHAGSRPAAAAYEAVERVVFRDATTIVVTGQVLAEDVRRRHPGVAEKIFVVSPGPARLPEAAPALETRSRLGLEGSNRRVVLFLGRLVGENGLMDLVEAFAAVAARQPEAVLWVAGEGPEEPALRARISSRRLDDRVRWLGTVRGQEKFDIVAAADVLVRFSTHEVYPEAYLEALSVGTPVVATDAGDTGVLARESGAVVATPKGDAARAAEALVAVLEDAGTAAEMGRRGIEWSRANLWQRRAPEYRRILEEAAAS